MSKPSIRILLQLLAVVVANVDAQSNARDTTVATYNAALIEVYPEVETRASILIDQIIKSDVDIFCLQEIWFGDIQKQIYNGVKDYYPYALSAVDLTDNTVSSEPACTSDMLNPVLECQMTSCPGLMGADLKSCAILRCTELFASLPEPCVICLILTPDVASNESQCLTDPASRYEKTYGLMILSTKELQNPLAQGQNNQSQLRGLLTASVDGVGDLLCTHFTARASPTSNYGKFLCKYTVSTGRSQCFEFGPPIVSPFLYSSQNEQQYHEVLRVLDYAVNVDVPILMGDFNHGPAAPGGISWELPFHYGLMNARGLLSPYIIKDGRCTRCPSESAFAAIVTSKHQLIDHIYIASDTVSRVISAERIFDNVFTPNGLSLSDHDAIKMKVSNIRKNCSRRQKCLFFCESEIKDFLILPPPSVIGEVCFP